ncbi:interleukin-13 receptor subunit alpha-1 [Callorhinchus milii]|uniref:Fibronectin type-III domain-containing protein n=3 Tax=Callorhinchus milii TaxID=7868 RepID=A0A4W3I3U9_CALMI|nr:interleukin-13 receptor subunit alpha-1 [Callorhinchus milii]|eukprot:gi/632935576/ref/XP_007890565.1/ PREDICTED: interleukin-13 receptor subunit alpha-1 [Callorhinchus milii]
MVVHKKLSHTMCGLLSFVLLLMCLSCPGDSSVTSGASPYKTAVLLPCPDHLNFTLRGLCVVTWTWIWKPPDCVKNLVRYESQQKYGSPNWEETKINPHLNRTEVVNLNEGISFRVRAKVNSGDNNCAESSWCQIYIRPPPGNPETAVRNFGCILYNFEYINCTWDIGNKAPANTTYWLQYWQSDVEGVQNCKTYIMKENKVVGCQLQKDEFNRELDFNICVGSESPDIKSYYYTLHSQGFVKLSPPSNVSVSRNKQNFTIKWKIPSTLKEQCVDYNVKIKVDNNDWEEINIAERTEVTYPVRSPESHQYTIKVRAIYTDRCGMNGKWSEWSSESTFGEESFNWRIPFFIIVVIFVAFAAILLLTYLKRLQILILPPIPDPAKMFKGVFGDQNVDFSTWIKQPKENMTWKPEEEVTCPVLTVEKIKVYGKEGNFSENEMLEEQTLPVYANKDGSVDDNCMLYNMVTL